MLSAADTKPMQLAIILAKKGIYTTRANPRVGAVIVKDGTIHGKGWHRRAGSPHAEIEALTDAGDNAKGATCYVTLEPCCHFGKTAPCVDALIEAGISRIVYGHEDPNPLVGGAGITKLRQHNIQVDGPFFDKQCRQLNPGFIKNMALGLPWVRIKLAMSVDGRTAMANGDSFWITGPKARRDVQLLRAQSCAVVSSWATIQRDKASLTLRPKEFELTKVLASVEQPLRVMLNSRGDADINAPFFKAAGNILIATALQPSEVVAQQQRLTSGADAKGIALDLFNCPNDNAEGVNLRRLLEHLAQQGVNEVLVEAGPRLAAAFVRLGLFDELLVYMAPKLMGSKALPLLDLNLDLMDEALPMSIDTVEIIGRDVKIRLLPERE